MPSRRRLVLTEALPAPREAGEHEEGARVRPQDDHQPALGRYARDFGLDDVGAFLRCSAGRGSGSGVVPRLVCLGRSYAGLGGFDLLGLDRCGRWRYWP